MSTSLQDIDQLPNGARFYTADLHVHSYGGSVDVKDSSMTVNAIIDEAINQNIGLLSITDHNSIVNVQAALDYAVQFVGQLLVLPGVEVTTAHGHLLAYFPPSKLKALTTFLGKIDIKGEFATGDLHTELSMASVIGEAERLGGVCVAAHIDRPKTGVDCVIQGYPNSKSDIVRHSGLYGVEVDDPQHLVWYSTDDEKTNDGGQRTRLLNLRSLESSTQGRAQLAHVQNSDAHSLQAFRDQSTKKTLTKYKMNELTFDAFRMALVDPGARIRTQVSIPPLFPRILGMHIEGGFLDGQTIHFADNLNCLFGGRGTGKSTAIQSLAYGLGLRSGIEGYDNCPDTVTVYCEDDAGTVYRYIRQKGFDPDVKAKTGSSSIDDVPSDAFRMEFYGQGELAEVAKDPLKTPQLLQEFLDKHISLADLFLRESELLSALGQNSAQLIPLEASATQLADKTEALRQIEKKLQIAQEGKVSELADFQTRLTAEKAAVTSFEEFREGCEAGISLRDAKCDVDDILPDFEKLTKDDQSTPLLNEIAERIGNVNAQLDVNEKAINASLKTAGGEIDAIILKVKARHAVLNQQIGAKVAELQKKGLTASVVELTNLLKQKTTITSEINRIKGQSTQLKQYRENRANLLSELQNTRDEIVQRRKSQLHGINQHLGSTVRDYSVNVYYDPKGICHEYIKTVGEVMRGTYFQDEMTEALAFNSTPQQLAEWVRKKDAQSILMAIGSGKTDWATQIIEKCGTFQVAHRLEVLWKPPAPLIKVLTKGTKPRQIPVGQLSDGQKHTILLTIAMLAESNLPLVIDQPEDDLDNAFISSTIVTTLRAIKERRQVILVTHNANIAVLGDSELLLPMRRSGESGEVYGLGSIDSKETRTHVQDILEGGELAFKKRKEIYGY